MTIDGVNYEINNVELHLPVDDDVRFLYMLACTDSETEGFGLWEIELALLGNIDDLDGKRIHIKPNGENYDDDTLGTDIIGADMITDLNYLNTPDACYSYGDIMVDFKRIEYRTYQIHIEMTLTESEEDPEDLSPEDYNITGSADFLVNVDENNPTEF